MHEETALTLPDDDDGSAAVAEGCEIAEEEQDRPLPDPAAPGTKVSEANKEL